ncbi:50S ribosomal protein L9 [Buchnera aphidicola]|uniref:50S ribosomal protein L9 n=1 Tax=Buchnera aphidicola TaxID=9 RepID=UPI0034645CE7
MKIILLKTLKNLGDIGKVIEVKPGYARNYLIPTGKAILATLKNIKFLEQKKYQETQKIQSKIIEVHKRINQIKSLGTVRMFVQAREKGRIFGSIGSRELANYITNLGVPVHRKEIILECGSIRQLGNYKVCFKPHKTVSHIITVNISLKNK